mmetsp:Transcript_39250/g.44690  ORF Transcript_39250/g.44690 Transcript_39250/m.44690 type:complete len:162 (+) Transcript_39250:45-530(+)
MEGDKPESKKRKIDEDLEHEDRKRIKMSQDEESKDDSSDDEPSKKSKKSKEKKKKSKKSKKTKKSKKSRKESDSESSGSEDDDEDMPSGMEIIKDEVHFELSSKKKCIVRKFRGKVLIDLREFWEKDGQLLPTKKGVALNSEGWAQLKKWIPYIDSSIEEM